jgi:alkylation response protein AidB-like acyl-CoA dehydrogenase
VTVATETLEFGALQAAALDDPGDPAEVAAAFAAAAPGLAHVPLPGSGRTAVRFAVLEAVGAESPALGRLVEGHLDALAILAELGAPPPDGARLGVWAAEPAGATVTATARRGGWQLHGAKPYASGAGDLTHALVTARAGDERMLFLVGRDHWRSEPGTWQAVGMAGSDSPTVMIDATLGADALIADAGGYLRRPGFWHGGIGVAAVWFGGARGVARPLRHAGREDRLSAHGAAHLGAVEVALACGETLLAVAADAIDADPLDADRTGEARARVVRARIEQVASETLDRVGRALGAGPLCHDRAHARRVADLTVYLRQSHGDDDLACLGRLLAATAPAP